MEPAIPDGCPQAVTDMHFHVKLRYPTKSGKKLVRQAALLKKDFPGASVKVFGRKTVSVPNIRLAKAVGF